MTESLQNPVPYKVLATKYRPQTFKDLIGQEVLVRTLTNAIERNRIANAFLLTGIRGVGKTTTARIIARALNCIGEDGNGGPTTEPCGVCSNCVSIKEDRHPDILEMDAASRTGVDDIREIIENSHYLPTSARYKIFIIDEVHMLSKNAFNALLKTLEEPPSHVKFIFATTEIQKIPITILSRCQRFDLRRIQISELVSHLKNISKNENAEVTEDALRVIASASEGSVRDSLSMLDQAISQNEDEVSASDVRNMLGLADHSRIYELFEIIASGDTKQAIAKFDNLYHDGADPLHMIEEIMECNYLITSIKVGSSKGNEVAEDQRVKASKLAESLSVSYLSSMWQMLLKGLQELRYAPNALMAGEMLMVRITHLSDLPSPAKLIENYQQLQQEEGASSGNVGKHFKNNNIEEDEQKNPLDIAANNNSQDTNNNLIYNKPDLDSNPINISANTATAINLDVGFEPSNSPQNFEDLVALFKEKKEILLHEWLFSHTKLVSFKQGVLEINISKDAPVHFTRKISELLSDWTGIHWQVTSSKISSQPTLKENQQQKSLDKIKELSAHPSVAKWLEEFPNAKVLDDV